jgi:hypothetical protein
MVPRLAPLALAAFLLLSGCAGKSPEADAGLDGSGDEPGGGQGSGSEAGTVTSIAAPTWSVGQWWEWQTRFGDGAADDTFCSIVTATGSGYTLATEKDGMAKEDAAFNHPLLGSIRQGDLAFDAWADAAWSVLDFPLTDGKTYTKTIPNIAWDVFLPSDTVDVRFAATFLEGDGAQQVGLRGTNGEHLLVDAVYDSGTGWFSRLDFYDVDPGQEALEVGWTAVATGTNYTGPYFHATAEPLLVWFDGLGFDDDPTQGGQPFANPNPYATFTVAGGENHRLYGALVAEAVAGGRAVVLIGPDHQARHVEVVDPVADGDGMVLWLDEPALAGQWHIASAGAGGFSGGFAELYEVVLTESQM